MKIESNIHLNKISWLSTIYRNQGVVRNLYIPEKIEELVNLCSQLYIRKDKFDIVGHTSNIYFCPDYTIDNMVSTRKLKKYEVLDKEIVCECGVPVSSLAKDMCDRGIKGFEGLIDLPGTVAAAIYGNADCYNSSISSLLLDLEYLSPNGNIKTISASDCHFSRRMSAFKEGRIKGVILKLRLSKEFGNVKSIKECAKKYHDIRKSTQPGPQKNIGSIHGYSGSPVPVFRMINFIANILVLPIILVRGNCKKNFYKTKVILFLTGRVDLMPYLFNLNRFIFVDEKSHVKFIEYLNYYKKYFPDSRLEIEVRE